MADAEEDSLLFNKDDPENCSNLGSPCGWIDDVLREMTAVRLAAFTTIIIIFNSSNSKLFV
jgi:hypothetical protein